MNHKALSRLLNTIFFIVQLLLISVFMLKAEYMHVFQSLIILAVFLLLIYFEKRFNLHIENYIRGLIILALISHSFIGEYLKVYDTSFVFDKTLHFFGTFSYTLLVYSILVKTIYTKPNSNLFSFILIASLGISLGTVFEIIEFTGDTFFHSYCQKGLLDTNLDMLFNIFGSCLAGILLSNRQKINYLNSDSSD